MKNTIDDLEGLSNLDDSMIAREGRFLFMFFVMVGIICLFYS